MKTLILLGNGKSISSLVKGDFMRIQESGADMMSINGAFKLWNNYQWAPKYHFFGRELEDIWGQEEIHDFFTLCRNNKTTIIVKSHNYMDYPRGEGIIDIILREPPTYSPNVSKWCDSFEGDVKMAWLKKRDSDGEEEANKAMALNIDINPDLNWRGITKVWDGRKHELVRADFTSAHIPRYNPLLVWPTAFDQVYVEDSDSGSIGVKLASLMGYTKVLLYGFDFSFMVNEDLTVNNEETFGIENIFNGKKYLISRDVVCPDCQNTESLKESMGDIWKILSLAIAYNEIDLEVVNCTPNSNLKHFRMSTLEKELCEINN